MISAYLLFAIYCFIFIKIQILLKNDSYLYENFGNFCPFPQRDSFPLTKNYKSLTLFHPIYVKTLNQLSNLFQTKICFFGKNVEETNDCFCGQNVWKIN